jgi:hypothetical protein
MADPVRAATGPTTTDLYGLGRDPEESAWPHRQPVKLRPYRCGTARPDRPSARPDRARPGLKAVEASFIAQDLGTGMHSASIRAVKPA